MLEIGCGPGALLSDLASLHDDVAFLGIDVDPKMIAHARERHARDNVRYELVDLRHETPEEPADFAFSIDVLHHVGDLGAFLAGVHRSLRPHATWLAIEPNVFHPYVLVSQERMRRAGHDEDHFRPWRTEPLFTEAGFELLDRRYAFFFPGWMQRVPPAVARIEPPLERFRLLGGSVVYRLERAT